ncbi:MAG: methyltransferase [Oscillospiraceae bacterium]|jgi:hypothetical protein|nr:methyltransferase [Oscillospiraceae bacterium]
MNRPIPFSKTELTPIDSIPGFFGRPALPIFNTPLSARENYNAFYWERRPWWLPAPSEGTMLIDPLYNDRLGRGGPDGTTDSFGIEWEYIASAGGSIVRPGEPFVRDANELKDKIKFPDIDSWDWAKTAAETKCDSRILTTISFVNGFWFERLISFMDFAPAAMALIDDEQSDAVAAFFDESTAFACKLVDKYCEYFPGLDGFDIHDDWGAQKAPFFSESVAYELFVPHMKQLTDHIHSKGRVVTLHSCGHVEDRVKCFIDGGFDAWTPQAMNDTHRLYDEVGDKIAIAVIPEKFDPATTSPEKQRELGMAFAEKFTQPRKLATVSYYGGDYFTPAFHEGLYEKSREIYRLRG